VFFHFCYENMLFGDANGEEKKEGDNSYEALT